MRRVAVHLAVAVVGSSFATSIARACDLHTGLNATLHAGMAGSPAIPGIPPHYPSLPHGGPEVTPDVPAYNSLAGAHAKIYLDFDGDNTPDWGGGLSPGITPAYDTDGNPNTFSPGELANLHEIWSRVAEKFSIFNLNVTTVDPGNDNDLEVVHVVIGGDGHNGMPNYWPGGRYGGIGYVGGFSNSDSNKVFVFPGNLQNGSPSFVAEASSHETGHSFLLQHQSTYEGTVKIDEYNRGDKFRAPIMGNSYYSERGLWWNGQSSLSSGTIQDDLLTMGNPFANGFGFRVDDHGGTIATSDPMTITGSGWSASGIIGFFDFADYFNFSTAGGTFKFAVDGAPFGQMLDASLYLYATDGTLLASSATTKLNESFFATLGPGTYAVAVTPAGSYGDLGQYTLSVTVPEPTIAAVAFVGSLTLLRRRFRLP